MGKVTNTSNSNSSNLVILVWMGTTQWVLNTSNTNSHYKYTKFKIYHINTIIFIVFIHNFSFSQVMRLKYFTAPIQFHSISMNQGFWLTYFIHTQNSLIQRFPNLKMKLKRPSIKKVQIVKILLKFSLFLLKANVIHPPLPPPPPPPPPTPFG